MCLIVALTYISERGDSRKLKVIPGTPEGPGTPWTLEIDCQGGFAKVTIRSIPLNALKSGIIELVKHDGQGMEYSGN